MTTPVVDLFAGAGGLGLGVRETGTGLRLSVDADLKGAGWTSLRIWEHESAGAAADRVVAILALLRDGA